MIENLIDSEILKFNLQFISMFVALYENFCEGFKEQVKHFLCDWEIKDGKEVYTETSNYKKEIKNRVVDDKNNKDVLKATLLWFVDSGAITKLEYDVFLEIKSKRNSYVHEMSKYIYEGIPTSDVNYLVNLMSLYRKLDKWWINEIEMPISGISDDYDKEDVKSLSTMTFEIMLDVLFGDNPNKYKEIYENFKETTP